MARSGDMRHCGPSSWGNDDEEVLHIPLRLRANAGNFQGKKTELVRPAVARSRGTAFAGPVDRMSGRKLTRDY